MLYSDGKITGHARRFRHGWQIKETLEDPSLLLDRTYTGYRKFFSQKDFEKLKTIAEPVIDFYITRALERLKSQCVFQGFSKEIPKTQAGYTIKFIKVKRGTNTKGRRNKK